MRLSVVRWFLSLPAAMFYCIVAFGLSDGLDSLSALDRIVDLLAAVCLASSIAFWVLADVRHRQKTVSHDFGALVFFAWPIVVPIYLLSTRGLRGFATLGWFLLLYFTAAVASVIPQLLE